MQRCSLEGIWVPVFWWFQTLRLELDQKCPAGHHHTLSLPVSKHRPAPPWPIRSAPQAGLVSIGACCTWHAATRQHEAAQGQRSTAAWYLPSVHCSLHGRSRGAAILWQCPWNPGSATAKLCLAGLVRGAKTRGTDSLGGCSRFCRLGRRLLPCPTVGPVGEIQRWLPGSHACGVHP